MTMEPPPGKSMRPSCLMFLLTPTGAVPLLAMIPPVWCYLDSVISERSLTSFEMTTVERFLSFRQLTSAFKQFQNLLGGAHARHARKDQLHEHVVGALVVGRAAGIADDDHVIV